MEGGRRRLTLYDQMLAVGDSRELSGLTLNDVLTIHKRTSPNRSPAVQLHSRTLLDIIRDDDFHVGKVSAVKQEKKYWKSLRDRLRLKRTVAAWTSSISIPITEISIWNTRSNISPRNSVRIDSSFSPNSDELSQEMIHDEESPVSAAAPTLRPQISRRNSTRFSQNAPTPPDPFPSNDTSDAASSRSLRPQMSRHNSTRFSMERSESFADLTDPARDGTRRLSAALAEERSLSAREAVAAQEAADAEAAVATPVAVEEEEEEETAAAAPTETTQPVRMSLMDLLEETDRQMGFEGSRYTMADEDDEEEEEEEQVEDEEDGEFSHGGEERNCCVCMVRHKGSAFIPCGHTFCRLCSRELWVSRGNCPLCNGFILEILDIF